MCNGTECNLKRLRGFWNFEFVATFYAFGCTHTSTRIVDSVGQDCD